MSTKKIKENNWLKDLSIKDFKEVWTEWYLPALRSIAHNIQSSKQKMDLIIDVLAGKKDIKNLIEEETNDKENLCSRSADPKGDVEQEPSD